LAVVCPTPSSGQEENLDRSILELDEAWRALSVMDPRRGKLVESMFHSGLFIEDKADLLRISSFRVNRDLTVAPVSLHRELDRTGGV
jgi:hypothetical protein